MYSETDTNSYLKEEYFKLQDYYEDYDRRALQIKGWVGAASIAALALGLDPKTSGSGVVWLLVAVMSACFWYLESKWKLFQYATADRIRILEAHFRNDPDILFKNPQPCQIYHWWFHSYANDDPLYPYEEKYRPRSRRRRLIAAAGQSFVHLPYSIIIAICVVFYLFRSHL